MGVPLTDVGALHRPAPRTTGRVTQVVELAKRHLHMDFAFVSQTQGEAQRCRATHGDAQSFGIGEESSCAWLDTYCRLMLAGQVPNAVPDASADPVLGLIPETVARSIGAYIGVPIRLRNGDTYGTLGCLAHAPAQLDGRDVGFLQMLAEVIIDDLQLERESDRNKQRLTELIDQDLFETYFQAIISLTDGQRLGVEALTRFPPGWGPPDETFTLAHQLGLGTDLEARAIERAIGCLDRLPADQFLSVNITPEALKNLTHQRSARPSVYARLIVELTEHAVVTDYHRLRIILHTLREEGIRLAVDDAGSGWASLHHVIELQPDIIKIDRSLVHGLPEDPSRRSVVRALVSIAGDIDATVIAEGVETVHELDAARALGVHAAQGYCLGRPNPDLA